MGILDHLVPNQFVRFHAMIAFRDRLAGGSPSDPELVKGWLSRNLGVENKELIAQMAERHLREMGVAITPGMTVEEMQAVAEAVAETKGLNRFKADDLGLYLETRHIKAMLREATNILYAGHRWGPTGKGAKAYFVERCFVNSLDPARSGRVYLGRTEPDGIETFTGHVSGPQGPRSTLTRVEVCYHATAEFYVDVLMVPKALPTKANAQPEMVPCVDLETWAMIWGECQENGLGALRSQDYGKFDLIRWDQVERIGRFEPSGVGVPMPAEMFDGTIAAR